jgi:hypothetical protein
VAQAERHLPPWHTCEAVLADAFHLLGPIVVTADRDFRVYRRHSRQTVRATMPD